MKDHHHRCSLSLVVRLTWVPQAHLYFVSVALLLEWYLTGLRFSFLIYNIGIFLFSLFFIINKIKTWTSKEAIYPKDSFLRQFPKQYMEQQPKSWFFWSLSWNCRPDYTGFKKSWSPPAGIAQWVEHGPMNQRVTSLIPSQGTCLGCSQVPSRGHARGNHTLTFLFLSFSLPSPLSKNK